MDPNPPTVAGMPSRIDDMFAPVWTTVVGGPASEPDPGKSLFAAYTEVTGMTVETARKLHDVRAQNKPAQTRRIAR